MFATLFLGTVLAIFLTLGVVRGDAERGLLQPLVVRPIGTIALPRRPVRRRRGACLRGLRRPSSSRSRRVITGLVGGWWPDHVVLPAASSRSPS